MRLLHRLAAIVLLAQVGLSGTARECDRAAQPPDHAAHQAAQPPAEHQDSESCEHADTMTCPVMAACTPMAGECTQPPIAALYASEPQHVGWLLASVERSDRPELPPPRS